MMKFLKTFWFILIIPKLLLLECCCLLIAIFNNEFRGKYLVDRLAFLDFAEPEIEKFTGIKQTEEKHGNF